MHLHLSYTLAIFVILIAIPLIFIFWGFLNYQCTTKYSITLKPKECYFYLNGDLIPIHEIIIQKHKNNFKDVPKIENTIYVKEKELFSVPSALLKDDMIVKTFTKKGLQNDLIRSISKCTSVSISYGKGKNVIVEKII